jgi:hypothetical protein
MDASVIADVQEAFAEVRFGDPRLIVILASARIETALDGMLEAHPEVSKLASRFESRTNVAKALGLIDGDYQRYLNILRKVRNIIVHRPTRRLELLREPVAGMVSDLVELAAERSLFASLVAGVLVAETECFGQCGKLQPRSFSQLAGR